MNQDKVLFGAAYYHEYQPGPRLDEDLDLMVEAGFSVIRVGEATWASWEPEDGVFDLDWMQPVLDGAHARGLSVVLGTPTFALPMWLARKYPEIAIQREDGSAFPWGRREEMDYTNPAFLFHAERVIRQVFGRYSEHPSIIGYQLHNEPGLYQIYNRGAFEEFKNRLRRKHGTIEALNKAWGLTFWSHRLSTWEDLWRPEGNGQPQYDFAWRAFQADITSEYVEWLRSITEDFVRDGQFITTDMSMDRPTLHEAQLAESLDISGANPYYFMQDDLGLPSVVDTDQSWLTSGAWSVHMAADRVFGTKQSPFHIYETNAGAIGGPATNYPGYDGQLAQCGWSLVSRGAEMIQYWHWQTLHYGTETYWGGVLPHDQQPGRIYNEVASLGSQFAAAGDSVLNLEPDHDLAILYSVPSKWALSFQPHISESDADPHRQTNERAYGTIVESFYKGAFSAGKQVRIVHDRQVIADDGAELKDPAGFAESFPVLIVAGLYVASDELLDWLRRYALAGGHLILGPRTAIADLEACVRAEPKPARLTEIAGASYQEFSNLREPLPVESETDWLRNDSAAVDWVECLNSEDAETLARIRHPHFNRWSSVVTRVAGNGRVTTVGVVPNEELAKDLLSWACPTPSNWDLADSVRRSSAVNGSGQRVHFLFNWSWDPATVTAPAALKDAITKVHVSSQEAIELGPWGTRVLVEESPTTPTPR